MNVATAAIAESPDPVTLESVPTFLVNLEHDTQRLAQAMANLSPVPGLEITRIRAVYGKDLPDAVCFALSQSQFWISKRGELGCFLSHLKVWEKAAEEKSICLVLEDDGVPHGLERIHRLSAPADADLVFVNNRMTAETGAPDAPLEFLPITASIRKLNVTGLGVGTDGYMVTPAGARKLLEATAKDLYFGNIDWRLLRYSVSLEDLEGDIAGTRCDGIIRNHHNPALPPQWAVIKTYTLSNALVLAGRHPSSISEANKK